MDNSIPPLVERINYDSNPNGRLLLNDCPLLINELKSARRIMLDIDGCIGDFSAAMLTWLRDDMGVNISKVFPDPNAYSYKEATNGWSDIYANRNEDDDYIDMVSSGGYMYEPIDRTAVEVLNRLQVDLDMEVVIATNRGFPWFVGTDDAWRSERARQDTFAWIKDAGIKYSDIILTPDKDSVSADIYIEDSPKNINSLLRAGKNVIMIPHLYNRHVACPVMMDWVELIN